MESTWTITELAEQAVEALTAGRSVRSVRSDGLNGRVRDLPNERLIRWYTTIGLVDPPLGRRGRTALYGARHLLQIVAVKRRQAAGRSIAEIQAELAGATDRRLREIAQLPDPPPGQPPGPPPDAPPVSGIPGAPPRGDRGRARFWTAQPSVTTAPGQPEPPGQPDPSELAEHVDRPAVPALVHGVRLAPGVTVLLDPASPHPLDDDDLAAIEAAARPLLEALRRRGVIDDPPDNRTDILPADPSGRSQ